MEKTVKEPTKEIVEEPVEETVGTSAEEPVAETKELVTDKEFKTRFLLCNSKTELTDELKIWVMGHLSDLEISAHFAKLLTRI